MMNLLIYLGSIISYVKIFYKLINSIVLCNFSLCLFCWIIFVWNIRDIYNLLKVNRFFVWAINNIIALMIKQNYRRNKYYSHLINLGILEHAYKFVWRFELERRQQYIYIYFDEKFLASEIDLCNASNRAQLKN